MSHMLNAFAPSAWIQGDMFEDLFYGDVGASPTGLVPLHEIPDHAVSLVSTTALVNPGLRTAAAAAAVSGSRKRRRRARKHDERQIVFGFMSDDGALLVSADGGDGAPCDVVEAFARHEAALTGAVREIGSVSRPLSVSRDGALPGAEEDVCAFDNGGIATEEAEKSPEEIEAAEQRAIRCEMRKAAAKSRSGRMLTFEEERDLLTRFQKHGDGAALTTLVTAYQPLINRFVSEVSGYVNTVVSAEDLQAQGYLGLVAAARKFDLKYTNRFATFAVFHVHHEIYAFVLHQVSAIKFGRSVMAKTLFFKLRRRMNNLRAELGDIGQDALREAAAAEFDCTVGEISDTECRLSQSVTSLNIRVGEDGEGDEIIDLMASNEANPEEAVIAADVSDKSVRLVRKALDALDARERFIMENRALREENKMTLEEIGAALGITRERARQVEEQAKTKMRKRILTMLRDNPSCSGSIKAYLAG